MSKIIYYYANDYSDPHKATLKNIEKSFIWTH